MTENNQPPLVTSPYATPAEPTYPGLNDWPPAPAPKKKRWFLKPIVLLPVAALILGAVIGSAGKPAPETVTVAGPERVVTKEVKVEVTPAACKTALGYAEDVITSAGTTIGILGDTLKAASKFDIATITANNTKVDAQTAVIKGVTPKYTAAKADCLAK